MREMLQRRRHEVARILARYSAGAPVNVFANPRTVSAWTSTLNLTVTPNAIAGPDGTLSGTKAETTAAAATLLAHAAVVNDGRATVRFVVKDGPGATGGAFLLRNDTTSTNLKSITFDFRNGAITAGTPDDVLIRSLGDGWWEISLTAPITAGNTVRGYSGWTGGVTAAGDVIYVYGGALSGGGL